MANRELKRRANRELTKTRPIAMLKPIEGHRIDMFVCKEKISKGKKPQNAIM